MKRPYRIRRLDADRRPSLFREDPAPPCAFWRGLGNGLLVAMALWLALGITLAWIGGRLG